MWKGALVLLVVAVFAGSRLSTAPAGAGDDNTNQSILVTPSEPNGAATADSFHQSSLGGTLALPRKADGHFYASGEINGVGLDFLVDTGASIVALTTADAERAGITVDPAQFKVVAQGASGPVMGLDVVLPVLTVGDRRLTDVNATILPNAPHSLLGQNVLSRFQSVAIENDEMLLR